MEGEKEYYKDNSCGLKDCGCLCLRWREKNEGINFSKGLEYGRDRYCKCSTRIGVIKICQTARNMGRSEEKVQEVVLETPPYSDIR